MNYIKTKIERLIQDSAVDVADLKRPKHFVRPDNSIVRLESLQDVPFVQLIPNAPLNFLYAFISDQQVIVPAGYDEIATPQDLQDINLDLAAGNTTGKYYISQDLDFTGFGNFTPLGKNDSDVNINAFAGELHGGGHVISNLSTDAQAMASSGSYGLFRGLANGAYLKRFGMENCYCRGVSASYNSMVTGSPGGAEITVEDVFVLGGSVDSGGDRAGGMIGYTSNANSMYRRCYTAIPIVGGGFRLGGFCAWNAGMSSENSYRDSDNDGGAGAPASGGDGGVTPKTEAQMKQEATFTGWDFTNVWSINEGVTRPRLQEIAEAVDVHRFTWDAVSPSDGYNLYLKGVPSNFYTVYNGIDQYINIGCETYGTLMDTMTAEFEIKNTVDNKVMALTGVANDGFSMILAVYLNYDQTQTLAANKIFFQIRDHNANQLVVATTNAHPEVSDGQKHRISVSNDANNNTVIYIDGVSVPITKARNESLTNFIGFGYPLFLGATDGRGTVNNRYEGRLNDVRFWSVVRTSTQINDTLNTKLDGTETGLFAYYPMTENSGDITEDLAGTNNGTLVGNVSDNMWEVDQDSISTQFVKQNTALIATNMYDIIDLYEGNYEAYVKNEEGGVESDPSNIEVFTVT